MKTKVLVAAALMALGVSSAMANVSRYTAVASLDANNHIVIDAKSIALWQIFLGDANHVQAATSPAGMFSFAAGAADNYTANGSLVSPDDGYLADGLVDPTYVITAKELTLLSVGTYANLTTKQNTLRGSQPTFGEYTTANTVIKGTVTTSLATDTQIIANLSAIAAAGQYLWFQSQVVEDVAGGVAGTNVYQALTPVPEPTSIALLSLGSMALLRRRNANRA